MDFLTQLSIRYTEKSAVLDEEDPEDAGKSRRNYIVWFLLLLLYLTYYHQILKITQPNQHNTCTMIYVQGVSKSVPGS